MLPYDETDSDDEDDEASGAEVTHKHADRANRDKEVEQVNIATADQVTLAQSSELSSYRIAKTPTFSSVPLRHLEQEYGVSQFLPALTLFLQENLPTHALQPNKYDCYNIYNVVYITLPPRPHVSENKRQKTIHATAGHSNGPRKLPSPAQFDTALLIEDPKLHHANGGLSGTWILHILPYSV